MHDILFYAVTPSRPEAHYFTVRLRFRAGPEPERLCLPAWIPGSYMIRDFARNIAAIRAWSEEGEVALEPLDKQCWRLEGSGLVTVEYQVYAWDASVRAAHLDLSHAFFNGTSLFLRVAGKEGAPCELELQPPPVSVWGYWQVATTLPSLETDQAGFGRYRADDYWHLVDCPVEMGSFQQLDFEVEGVPHRMVVRGHAEFDRRRLMRDLERICAAQAGLFGELPVARYLFLTTATGEGYGGLEHRDSSVLLCSRKELPRYGLKGTDADYRRFLGLCSHEYFHLWNVKRIRPAALSESTLEREAYTRLLWAFEGITSYYDELMLARSGVVEHRDYLEMLAHTITRVMRTPGRKLQSLADSSFHAWTKFYKQDENAPNAIVSYYAKGALVALGLDVTLRLRSDDRLALDDLMRLLWERYGRPDEPVPEEGIRETAETLLGADLGDFFSAFVEGTEELPLARWLDSLGIGYRLRPANDDQDQGGSLAAAPEESPQVRPWLGAQWIQKGDFLELTRVLEGGPAQQAGLAAGDRLVAIDDLQVTAENLERLLTLPPGRNQVEVIAFRADELRRFALRPRPRPADTCELWLQPEERLQPEVRERRERWLTGMPHP